jgi:TolB protein
MTKNNFKALLLSFCIITLFKVESYARINIDINKGVFDPFPIAILDAQGNDLQSIDHGIKIRNVIINDLHNSGIFRIIDNNAFLESPTINTAPNFANWRVTNANLLLQLQVLYSNTGDTIQTFYKIWDISLEKLVESGSYKIEQKGWRRISHKIANSIYKRIIGVNGYFDSRIAFVSEKGDPRNKTKRLAIMDQDGANFSFLTGKSEYILSPRFNSKAQKIIYTSLNKGTDVSKVYILDLETGQKTLVGDNKKELAFAANFSPDQNKLILSLAYKGATNIYEIDLKTGERTALTNDRNLINTSPSFSSDGSKILFNSNLGGGKSQIYSMDSDGSNVTQISIGEGSYRTPVFSPDGEWIAFTKILLGKFYIGVMKTDGTDEKLLTNSLQEESPSWAPNSQTVIFNREDAAGHNKLYMVDISGYNEREVLCKTEASQPSWSANLN